MWVFVRGGERRKRVVGSKGSFFRNQEDEETGGCQGPTIDDNMLLLLYSAPWIVARVLWGY